MDSRPACVSDVDGATLSCLIRCMLPVIHLQKKCRLFLSPRAKEPVLIYHLGESVRGRGNGVRISRLLRDKGEILERKGIERLILRSSGPIFAPK